MKNFKKVVCIILSVMMLMSVVTNIGLTVSATESTETTVYFVNSKDWSNVYCYVWDADGQEAAWPGTAATLIDENNGIYAYDVKDYANFIFNNNAGVQTADLTVSDGIGKYYDPKSSAFYDTVEEALAAAGQVRVYDYYIAGDSALLGSSWSAVPQNGMTVDENGVYTLTIENVAAGTYEYKVTDLSGNWYPEGMGTNCKVVVENEGATVVFTFDPAAGVPSAEVSGGIPVETEATEAKETIVYFVNSNAWSEVYCYTWTDTTPEVAWPGTAATLVDEVNGVYSYDIKSYENYLFTNNASLQTSDLAAAEGEGKYYEPKTAAFYETAEEALAAAEQIVIYDYYVAGDEALLGSNWSTTDANNGMTADENGIYTLTIENVAAGTYLYKVASPNGKWYPDGMGTDCEVVVANEGATVVFTFDPAVGVPSAEVSGGTPVETESEETTPSEETPSEETEPTEAKETIVYFVNSIGWSDVYCYTWTDETPEAVWPGTAATLIDEENGVYSYDIKNNENYLFTNNAGVQTSDLTAEEGEGKYYEPKTAVFYDTVEEALAAAGKIVIYDYYVAGDEALLGSNWSASDPNNGMTADENGIYTLTIENVAAGTYLYKVTSPNGKWYPDGMGTDCKVVVANEGATVVFTFDPEVGVPSAEVSGGTPVETEPTEAKETIIYFVNSNAWSDVYCYTWTDETPEAVWPGTAATLIDEENGVYSYDIKNNENYLFTNNAGVQTSDLTAEEGEGKYYEPKTAVFYDTVEEALAAAGQIVIYDYYVAGDEALLGSNWSAADPNNGMTADENGIYTLTIENVAAGTYQYKVTSSSGKWYPDGPDNCEVVVANEGATVVFTFDPAVGVPSAEVSGGTPVESEPSEEESDPSEDPAPSYTLGDVNNDGKINIMDVAFMQMYAASLTSLSDTAVLAADVTGDGKVNIMDVAYVQMYIANLMGSFPASK